MFKNGNIDGVIIKDLKCFHDERGWLSEIFRADELPDGLTPQMAYISMTKPGVVRGPHEHVKQSDYFCFLSPFNLYLWDMRKDSKTYKIKCTLTDVKNKVVIVPPGVVHAYKNSSADMDGLVINLPDALYAGWQHSEAVDEIRYENQEDSPFVIE